MREVSVDRFSRVGRTATPRGGESPRPPPRPQRYVRPNRDLSSCFDARGRLPTTHGPTDSRFSSPSSHDPAPHRPRISHVRYWGLMSILQLIRLELSRWRGRLLSRSGGLCATCGALCCADCVELELGWTTPRAVCHACPRARHRRNATVARSGLGRRRRRPCGPGGVDFHGQLARPYRSGAATQSRDVRERPRLYLTGAHRRQKPYFLPPAVTLPALPPATRSLKNATCGRIARPHRVRNG
jgi:hypothetical protein